VSEELHLTWRQRATWMSHFAKAALRDHHQELEPLFGPLIAKDAVIADVGAHGGQMSRMFSRLAPRGTIHSFEPAQYARSVLEPALKFRGARNIRVWPYALSDKEGELTIATPIKKSSALGFGLAHVAAPGEQGNFRYETSRATTLDTFVAEQEIARLDFIKVDIEGWELHFLRGAQGALLRFKPLLFLEVSAITLGRAGETPAALFAFLAERQYRASVLTPAHRFEPVSAFKTDGDYLFSPS
jgi:FkbM family methyltransferase